MTDWVDVPDTITTGDFFRSKIPQNVLTNNLSLASVVLSRKTADQSITSNTTPQNDSDLFFQVGAGELWAVRFIMKVVAGGAVDVDLKVQFDGPPGTEVCIEGPGLSATGSFAIQRWFDFATTQIYNVTSTTPTIYVTSGLVYTAGVSGTFRLKWSQGNSSATATTMKAGSCILGTKLGTNPRLVT